MDRYSSLLEVRSNCEFLPSSQYRDRILSLVCWRFILTCTFQFSLLSRCMRRYFTESVRGIILLSRCFKRWGEQRLPHAGGVLQKRKCNAHSMWMPGIGKDKYTDLGFCQDGSGTNKRDEAVSGPMVKGLDRWIGPYKFKWEGWGNGVVELGSGVPIGTHLVKKKKKRKFYQNDQWCD